MSTYLYTGLYGSSLFNFVPAINHPDLTYILGLDIPTYSIIFLKKCFFLLLKRYSHNLIEISYV